MKVKEIADINNKIEQKKETLSTLRGIKKRLDDEWDILNYEDDDFEIRYMKEEIRLLMDKEIERLKQKVLNLRELEV